MAATMSSSPVTGGAIRRAHKTPQPSGRPTSAVPGRRHCLFLLTAAATAAVKSIQLPSPAAAQDIPLFGLRKKIQRAEEAAEEVVKEGIEAAGKELETAEKGIEAVETAVVTVDAAVQAAAVAGAEVLGVVVATSVVNGILGSD